MAKKRKNRLMYSPTLEEERGGMWVYDRKTENLYHFIKNDKGKSFGATYKLEDGEPVIVEYRITRRNLVSALWGLITDILHTKREIRKGKGK